MFQLNCTNHEDQTAGPNSTSTESCELFGEGQTHLKYIKAFAYSVLMVISLFGNLAVIFVVSKNKRMRTATNYLIVNMAASDLLISVFAVPRELVQIFTGPQRWLLDGLTGLILCKFVYFFQDISTAVSILSLVVIAIDRYRGIVFPFRSPIITSKVCKVIIPIIWMVAMCIHGTYFYTVRLVVQEDNKWLCHFSWAPKFDERRTQERYFIFVLIFLIVLPLCVILTLYALIVIDLKKRKLTENGASDLRRQRQREDAAIMKRILVIVFLFFLCITPITVSAILFYFVWDWRRSCRIEKLFSAAKFILYSNASLNPWVYIILNRNYRQGLKRLANCMNCKQTEVDRNNIEMNVL